MKLASERVNAYAGESRRIKNTTVLSVPNEMQTYLLLSENKENENGQNR